MFALIFAFAVIGFSGILFSFQYQSKDGKELISKACNSFQMYDADGKFINMKCGYQWNPTTNKVEQFYQVNGD